MLVPYANTNTAEEVILVEVSTKEFARLTYIRNDAFAILHIPTYDDEELTRIYPEPPPLPLELSAIL